MTELRALLEQGQLVGAHRPWPRVIIDAATWRLAGE
jgi:hypothetical protein